MPIVQPFGGFLPRRAYLIHGELKWLAGDVEDHMIDIVKGQSIQYYRKEGQQCPYVWAHGRLWAIPNKGVPLALLDSLKMTIKASLEKTELSRIVQKPISGEAFKELIRRYPELREQEDSQVQAPSIPSMTECLLERLPTEIILEVWELSLLRENDVTTRTSGASQYARFFLDSVGTLPLVSQSIYKQAEYILDKKVLESSDYTWVFQDHVDLKGFLNRFSTFDQRGFVTSTKSKTFHRVVIHLISFSRRITSSLVLPDEGPSQHQGSCYHGLAQRAEGVDENTVKWTEQVENLLSRHSVEQLRLVIHPRFTGAFTTRSPLVQMLLANSYRVQLLTVDGPPRRYGNLMRQVKQHME